MNEQPAGLPPTWLPGESLDGSTIHSQGAPQPRRVHQRTVVPALPARLGRFELRRRCGTGSSGAVFEAVDEHDGLVAIKLLDRVDDQRVASLKAEYLVASGLAHPNIVVPLEIESSGGAWFIVMERIEGCDLVTFVRGDGREDEAFVARLLHVAGQLVDAVAFLHEEGILHLDLKPANVLVRADASVAVLDFGLAGRTATDGEEAVAAAGGTPVYGAPEQFHVGTPGPEADCYALGGLLFEALTGRRPRTERQSHEAALRAACELDLRQIAVALRPLAALLPKLLQAAPSERAGMVDLARALRQADEADVSSNDGPIALSPGPVRSLLIWIVLAGHGLPMSWLRALPGEPIRPGATREVLLQRLVVRRWIGGEERLEATSRALRWRDEAVSSEEARAAHRVLAAVGERMGAPDEVVAAHLDASGDVESALDAFVRLADERVKRREFRKAAEVLASALDGRALSEERRVELGRRRAECLMRAGQCREAAAAYESVADVLPVRLSRVLRSLAAGAWLQAGDITRGLAGLADVLRAEGLAPPRKGLSAGFAMLIDVASLAIPVAIRVRAASGRDTAQVDLLWTGGRGLVSVVPETGLELMLRSAVIARRMGEPARYARVVAFLAMFLLQFPLLRRLGERAVSFAEDTALETGDAGLGASARLWRAGALVYRADWSGLEEGARGALARLLPVLDAEWERVVATGFVAWALQLQGDCRGSRELAAIALTDATARGDRYAQCLFAQYVAFGALAAGEPGEARRLCLTWVVGWETGNYSLADFYGMFLLAHCDLVEGQVDDAAARFRENDPTWHRAGGHRIALWRIDHALLHARILLLGPSDPPRLTGIARRLARETRPDAPLYGKWIRAAVLVRRGKTTEAEPLLVEARAGFRALGMHLYDASLGLGWAALSGNAVAAEAHRASLTALGVGDPDRWSRVFTPLGAS